MNTTYLNWYTQYCQTLYSIFKLAMLILFPHETIKPVNQQMINDNSQFFDHLNDTEFESIFD